MLGQFCSDGPKLLLTVRVAEEDPENINKLWGEVSVVWDETDVLACSRDEQRGVCWQLLVLEQDESSVSDGSLLLTGNSLSYGAKRCRGLTKRDETGMPPSSHFHLFKEIAE